MKDDATGVTYNTRAEYNKAMQSAFDKGLSGTMAVDTLSRPADQNVQRGVETVNQFQERGVSPTLTADVNRAVSTPAPAEIVDTRNQARIEADNIAMELAGKTSIVEERQQAREYAGVVATGERKRQLSNRLVERERQIQKQREALEKNLEADSRAGSYAELAKFNRESARELADLSFSYQVALGDYQAAEKIANDYISDLNADYERKQNTWSMLMKMSEMTDEEKMIATQNHQEKMMQDQFELDKKKLDYQSQLTRAELAYKASLEGDSTFSVSDRKTLFEMAEKGDTWAINAMGYDPRQLPEAQKENYKNMEDAFFKTEQGIDAVSDILEKTTSLSGVTTSTAGFLGAIARTTSAILPTADIRFKIDADGNKVLDYDAGGFTGQSDILSDLKYITANLTIEELGKMEVPLTPLSDADMRKVGEAASRLNGMLITKGEDQQIIGIRGSESKVREELNTIKTSLQRVQDEINAKMLSAEELTYIYQ